jgi:DNA repair protein RadC
MEHLRNVADADLVRVVIDTEVELPDTLAALAHSTPFELGERLRVPHGHALRLASAFELGRRGAWSPPGRGVRCLDPATVADAMRDVAHEEQEEFWVLLLDVRGRLLGRRLVARGSLT